MTRLEVLTPGALTTIQDLGRPGWAHLGVPRSGAADRTSLALANRLLGNNPGAAGLETTLVGPRLRADAETVLALTGAPVDGLPMNEPIELHAGDLIEVGTARIGLRTYIAFSGGLGVPLVLGSAATDLLTGLGPGPLIRGDVLETRAAASGGQAAAPPPQPAHLAALEGPDPVILRVSLGPRDDWFSDRAIEALLSEDFTVTQAANRIGARLQGPALARSRSDELLSEGLVPGGIQVPPDGQPILLLADHPTTGGYPVIAVAHSQDLPLAAQLRPGRQLRFTAAVDRPD